MPRLRHPSLGWLALLLIATLGALLLLPTMRDGIGIWYDSVIYLAMAEVVQQSSVAHLVQTESSYFPPFSHFPPFYSILLALLGADPQTTAIGLNALLFALSIGLSGLLIHQTTDANWWATLGGAGVVALAVPMYRIHSFLLTEPLFLTLTLTTLWALGHALRVQQRGWLVLAGLTAGLAFSTRYVGLTLVLTGGLALLLCSQRSWRGRILDAALFGGLAVLPVSLWFIRNTLVTGRSTTSTLAIYPIGIRNIVQFLGTLGKWLLPVWLLGFLLGFDETVPPGIPPGIKLVLALVLFILLGSVLGGILLLNRHYPLQVRHRIQQHPVLLILLRFGIVYVTFVVFSRVFLYANIPFDTRLLLPLFPVLVIWGSVLAHAIWHALPPVSWPRWIRRAVVVGCGLFLLSHALQGTLWLRACYVGTSCPLGYNAPAWRTSETIAVIRTLPAYRPVYTNDAFVVSFYSKATVNWLPVKVLLFTGKPNPNYPAELAQLQRALNNQEAVLAYFDKVKNLFMPTPTELQTAGISLRLWRDTADGALYVAE